MRFRKIVHAKGKHIQRRDVREHGILRKAQCCIASWDCAQNQKSDWKDNLKMTVKILPCLYFILNPRYIKQEHKVS